VQLLNKAESMSALGHWLPRRGQIGMSALPPKTALARLKAINSSSTRHLRVSRFPSWPSGKHWGSNTPSTAAVFVVPPESGHVRCN
jgi:hypothetical protein